MPQGMALTNNICIDFAIQATAMYSGHHSLDTQATLALNPILATESALLPPEGRPFSDIACLVLTHQLTLCHFVCRHAGPPSPKWGYLQFPGHSPAHSFSPNPKRCPKPYAFSSTPLCLANTCSTGHVPMGVGGTAPVPTTNTKLAIPTGQALNPRGGAREGPTTREHPFSLSTPHSITRLSQGGKARVPAGSWQGSVHGRLWHPWNQTFKPARGLKGMGVRGPEGKGIPNGCLPHRR
mmetsp:Transcript_144519/g.251952  ORF Transcript_144519/g.251952 Transcript_144519/m.251952 type:complete len:238 (+) Transcript_144519:556-1269(+)